MLAVLNWASLFPAPGAGQAWIITALRRQRRSLKIDHIPSACRLEGDPHRVGPQPRFRNPADLEETRRLQQRHVARSRLEVQPALGLVVADPDCEPLGPGHQAMAVGGIVARIPHDEASAGTQGREGTLEHPRLQLAREIVQHVAQQHRVASGPHCREQIAFLETQP